MCCDIKDDCNNVEEEIKKELIQQLEEKQVKKLEVEKVIVFGIYIIL